MCVSFVGDHDRRLVVDGCMRVHVIVGHVSPDVITMRDGTERHI